MKLIMIAGVLLLLAACLCMPVMAEIISVDNDYITASIEISDAVTKHPMAYNETTSVSVNPIRSVTFNQQDLKNGLLGSLQISKNMSLPSFVNMTEKIKAEANKNKAAGTEVIFSNGEFRDKIITVAEIYHVFTDTKGNVITARWMKATQLLIHEHYVVTLMVDSEDFDRVFRELEVIDRGDEMSPRSIYFKLTII